MIRESELQREVEVKTIGEKTERLRSEVMAKTNVDAESMERMAIARLAVAQRDAEALVARQKAEAEGNLALSEAEAKGIRLK